MAHGRQADPFHTERLRRRVLAAWADAPARFREDANTEEDHALSGYRDRAVVELAQNAADAAGAAGIRGSLRLTLRGDEFTAANTGAPLTPEGVESLATLRASAKRDGAVGGTVGRFGVGFAAVAALSDDVTIASHDGAVRWRRDWARDEVRNLPADERERGGLAAELAERAGQVPLLRLPFADTSRPPEGYDTAVTLRLRDERARSTLTRLLDDTGQALLLVLPDLAEVILDIDGEQRSLCADVERTAEGTGSAVTRVRDRTGERSTRWHILTRTGRFTPEDLSDRPTEERRRLAWSLTWAVALDRADRLTDLPADVPRVVHAPTPSDTALSLRALLIGTFPLTPDRRHVASGAATTTLLAEAAAAYRELLTRLDARSALDLVPQRSLAHGEFEEELRDRVLRELPDTPLLVTVAGEPIRPRDALLLEGTAALAEALADALPTALAGDYDESHPGLAQLRLHRVTLAELADLLADLDRPPEWWVRLYGALRAVDRRDTHLDDLGALPVPLADGRLVRGPRGLAILDADADTAARGLDPRALRALGVRVVHPRAADPLLVRLGAIEATESSVLADPRTEATVRDSLEAEDPDAVADAVLGLVAASSATVEDHPWLAELALRDSTEDYSPAGELMLPDSPLRPLLVADAPLGVVADDLVARHGAETLEAVGVLSGFAVVKAQDLTLGGEFEEWPAGELDHSDAWAEEVMRRLGDPELPPTVPEFAGVRDLELVRADRWERALELLSAPGPYAVLTTPTRVVTADGRTVDVPSYTAWWLRTGARIAGRSPKELRTADADPALAGLYDVCPVDLDPRLAHALGLRRRLSDIIAEPGGADDLLERLGEPQRTVRREHARDILTALADLSAEWVTPPDTVRATRDGDPTVADAEETLVVDAPDLLPLLKGRPVILVPLSRAEPVADVLDLALAGEEVEGRVTSSGSSRPVPTEVSAVLATVPATYTHHTELTVDATRVEWRYRDGRIHAATIDGLARGLCWASGQWDRRHLVAALLRAPERAGDLLAEADLDRH